MNPEDPGARPHAFSRGRPSDLVFQQIGTMPARAGERYDFWVETQLRHIQMARAGEFFLYDPALPQSLRLSDHRIMQIDLSRRTLAALFEGRPPAPNTARRETTAISTTNTACPGC